MNTTDCMTVHRVNRGNDGALYLFMDTFIGGKHVAIHYGTIKDGEMIGTIEWHKTVEAVRFVDIQPLVPAK